MPIHPNTRDEERRCSCCLILTGPYSSRDGLCSECAGSIQRIMAEEGCSQMEARAKWEQRYWGQGE